MCSPCHKGSVTSTFASSSCLICSPGYYADMGGQTQCKPCDPGKFTSFNGSISCQPCSPGTYSNVSGSITCNQCPLGYIASGIGSTMCVACHQGESASGDHCTPCSPGTYSSNAASASCTPCSPGYFSAFPGNPCEPCPLGQFAPVNGSTNCQLCNHGYYSSTLGSASCTPCPAGTSQISIGSTSCSQCPPGTFSSSEASFSCSSCTPGTVATGQGSSSCTPCAINTYTVDGISCQSCPIGSITPTNGSTYCVWCPAGTYYSSGICLACDYGTYTGSEGLLKCLPCTTGFYSDQQNTNTSLINSNGFYMILGASSCKPCSQGSFTNTTGSTKCLLCNDTNQFCGLATIKPLEMTTISQTFTSFDPYFDGKNNADAKDNNWTGTVLKIVFTSLFTGLCLITLSLLLFIVYVAHKTGRYLCIHICLKRFDSYALNHPVEVEKSPVNSPKTFGGIMSVFYYFLACIVISYLVTDVAFSNYVDDTGIAPPQVVSSVIRDIAITGDFIFNIDLYNFPSTSGECSSASTVESTGFQYENGNLVTKYTYTGSTCNIVTVCHACNLTGETQTMLFKWNGQSPLCTNAFQYTVSVPHFYNSHQINTTEIVQAPNQSTFAGGTPTQISLSLTKSYFTSLASDYFFYNVFTDKFGTINSVAKRSSAGYVISRYPTTPGSTISNLNYASDANQLSIQFSFSIASVLFQVNQSASYQLVTWISFVLPLLGSVSGVVLSLLSCLYPKIGKKFEPSERTLTWKKVAPVLDDLQQIEQPIEEQKQEYMRVGEEDQNTQGSSPRSPESK